MPRSIARLSTNWPLQGSSNSGVTVFILGNPGSGKSHLAQAIGMTAILAGFRVIYREAHVLFEELLLAAATGAGRKRLQRTARYRCSFSTILACESFPLPRQKICWRS